MLFRSGGFDSYIKLIDEFEMYQGGFIWDFIDQAILVKDHVTGKEGENIAGNGVIKVNPEVKNGTPAIGRTPVVRVDAFLTSNAGEKKLVASSYIKLEITETSQAPDEKPDYGIIDMSADKAADYHKLEGDEKAFTNDYNLDNVSMDYQAINNKIYGTAKLTSKIGRASCRERV